MLDAAANTERLGLLRELHNKRRLFIGLGVFAALITCAGVAIQAPVAIVLGIAGVILNILRVRKLAPHILMLSEMAPERAAARRTERLRGAGPLPVASVPPPPPAPILTALREAGMDWPLHDTERFDDEPEEDVDDDDLLELVVGVDDVAGYDLDEELDALTAHLDALDGVKQAYRSDRELIVVETAGPAAQAIARLDAHAAGFLRDAVVRRYTPR